MWAKSKQPGFTIVELLIVIVVIGILAAITIVAYSGIQTRAVSASLTSDLDSASKLLKLFQVDNGAFPATIDCAVADSTTNKCLRSSSGTTYQYDVNNGSNPQTFCVNATKSSQNYKIAQDGSPSAGDCLSYGLVVFLDAGNPTSYPGSGTTWTDLSGNGNNGTLMNGVGYNGANGGGLTFDGINDYVTVHDSSSLRLANNFTVSGWIKLANQSSFGIVHKGDNTIQGAGLAYGYDGNGFMFISWNGTNSPYRARQGADANQWHYLAGVVSNSMRSLYVDGVLVGSNGYSASSWNTTNDLIVGGGGGPTTFMNGTISKVSVYSRVLSDVEIQQDFNQTRGRYGV